MYPVVPRDVRSLQLNRLGYLRAKWQICSKYKESGRQTDPTDTGKISARASPPHPPIWALHGPALVCVTKLPIPTILMTNIQQPILAPTTHSGCRLRTQSGDDSKAHTGVQMARRPSYGYRLMLMQTHPADNGRCKPIVHIVNGDEAVRDSLANAIRGAGLNAVVFASAAAFLSSASAGRFGCLLLDFDSLHIDDCVAQATLLAAASTMPLVLIVGQDGIPGSVRALKTMAVDFLLAPFEDHALVESLMLACEQGSNRFESELRLAAVRIRYASLTMREKQVLALVTEGLMNKQVAARLNLQVITVKVHRATMMRKMRCRRLVELVRAADTIDIEVHPLQATQRRISSWPSTTGPIRADAVT
jgi:FixJ family two-component response regulator